MSRTDATQHRSLAGEEGTVAVEFALIFPVILVVILLVVDFGRVFNYFNDANQIAAQGARLAAVNNYPGDAAMAKEGDTNELVNGSNQVPDKLTVCHEFPNGGSRQVGDPVKVVAKATYKLTGPIGWLGSTLGGGTISIRGEATMRLERASTLVASC